MGRPKKLSREPFWFADRRAWYVAVGTTKRRLSPDKDEAWRLWHELMARPPEERVEPAPAEAATVVEVLDRFAGWCRRNRAPRTYDAYQAFLQLLLDSIPKGLAVADLRPHHLTAVMDARDWSPNTKHDFVTTIKRAFNWAADEGLIQASPIERMKKPAREAREVAATPADYAAILAAVEEPRFRELVELAWETGARVQELRIIEARHFDGERIVLPPKESKGKRSHRVIYLAEGRARGLVAELCQRNPSGPILLNSKGRPWTKDAINCAFQRLKNRAGIAMHLGALRKGYATEALKAGVDTVSLGHLMGHRDGAMVSRVYGRVQQDPEHMARMAGRAKRGKVSPGDA